MDPIIPTTTTTTTAPDPFPSTTTTTPDPIPTTVPIPATPSTSTDPILTSTTNALAATKPKRPPPKRIVRSRIPSSILDDPALNSAVASLLPANYDFEVHKCVHRCLSLSARRVALQFPDGLLLFSLPISDILRRFASVHDPLVLADPSYGACCLDDLSPSALRADLLIHFGHSCLVPVSQSLLPVLYVFVDIRVDVPRLVSSIRSNFQPSSSLALAGTIQFNSAIHSACSTLTQLGYTIVVPQSRPLSAGEVLGCTSPRVAPDIEAVVFVADGRFHMEAFMIANPRVRAYRYDPYLGVMFLEEYDHIGMKAARRDAIVRAQGAQKWGVVLGTLGRQGSTKVLDRVIGRLEEKGMDYTVVLMSELSPARMALFGDSIEAWVQVACPRLSIDWGEAFTKPMLMTFELEVALGYVKGWWEGRGGGGEDSCSKACGSGSCGCSCKQGKEEDGEYPMDYYAQDGGEWNSSYARNGLVSRRVESRVQAGTKYVQGQGKSL